MPCSERHPWGYRETRLPVSNWCLAYWSCSISTSNDDLLTLSATHRWRHFLNIQGLRKPASRRRPLVHAPWDESYRWIDLRAIRQMPYFVVAHGDVSKGPPFEKPCFEKRCFDLRIWRLS